MPTKEQILEARKAVEAYRLAHAKLYEGEWHKAIPDAHTPLIEQMLDNIKLQGFKDIEDFFVSAYEENAKDGWK